MDIIEAKDLIGTNIVYLDYLGQARSGSIGYFEPYHSPDGEAMVWLYIVDEDPEYNIHTTSIDLGNSDIRMLHYAELRLNTEVSIDN